MAAWLLKTEPNVYSWEDLERDRRTVWDGVRNNAALKHMRSVRAGDQALVYHSGEERAAVGLARIATAPYPDPRAGDPRLVVFDLEPVRRLPRPVTLAEVKADPAFAGFALVREPRLSVMPVPPALWKRLLALAE
jgi:predicted RNA-binding protein with PUA-like domain